MIITGPVCQILCQEFYICIFSDGHNHLLREVKLYPLLRERMRVRGVTLFPPGILLGSSKDKICSHLYLPPNPMTFLGQAASPGPDHLSAPYWRGGVAWAVFSPLTFSQVNTDLLSETKAKAVTGRADGRDLVGFSPEGLLGSSVQGRLVSSGLRENNGQKREVETKDRALEDMQ